MNVSEKDAKRFWPKVSKGNPDDCWHWLAGMFSTGYGSFWMNGRDHHAHRIAFSIENNGIPSDRPIICHKCDNPICCNPAHLFCGTTADNQNDMKRKGRSSTGAKNGKFTRPEKTPRGVGHGMHVLSDDQIREIRSRYIPRIVSQRRLAAEFGTCQSNIKEILKGRTWTHVI